MYKLTCVSHNNILHVNITLRYLNNKLYFYSENKVKVKVKVLLYIYKLARCF